jgi:hypothetical protein
MQANAALDLPSEGVDLRDVFPEATTAKRRCSRLMRGVSERRTQ